MAEESKTTVLAAMGVNLAIAVGKLIAGLITHSSALLAEAGHSVADTVNQIFLLIGINLSHNSADELHPHGYGKEGFFWSFLAAIFIFVAGAAFSFYEGTRTLIQDEHGHRTVTELLVGFGVLAMAFAFESVSWMVAVRSILKGAREKGWTFWHFIRRSPDLSTKTVFWEDSAALIGLTFAAVGLALSEVFHHELWDGLASIGIGFVLTAAALILGAQSRSLLLGAAASRDVRREIRDTVKSFPDVVEIVRLLTMQLGTHSVLVTGEIEVRRHMETDEIEELVSKIDARLAETVPEVSDTFWELRRASPATPAGALETPGSAHTAE
jgi:cation diffusion facilitator family transporter